MNKTIFVGLFIGLLVTVAMVASNILPAVYADQGGDPNNKGPSQLNADDRDSIKDARAEQSGKNGPFQAHNNMHEGNGVGVV